MPPKQNAIHKILPNDRFSRYELEDLCEMIKNISQTIHDIDQIDIETELKEESKKVLRDILKTILNRYGATVRRCDSTELAPS